MYQEAAASWIKNYLGKSREGVNFRMMLIPKYITSRLPPLYAKENDKDPKVICKFFLPMTRWYWYAMEFDGKDTLFGYIVGDFNELGYFSLSELQSIEGLYGLKVERDLYFDPMPLSQVKKFHVSY